jgi:hypothetical protein
MRIMDKYLKRAELAMIPKEAEISIDDCEFVAKSKGYSRFDAMIGKLDDNYYLFEKNKPCRPLHLASTYTWKGEITSLNFQYTPDDLHVYHVSCNPQTHILGNPESRALELEDITAGMSCNYAGITLTYNGKGSVTIQANGKTKEMKVEDDPKYTYKFLKTKIKAKNGAEGLFSFMEEIAENKNTYGETPYCGAYEVLGSVFEKPRQFERD